MDWIGCTMGMKPRFASLDDIKSPPCLEKTVFSNDGADMVPSGGQLGWNGLTSFVGRKRGKSGGCKSLRWTTVGWVHDRAYQQIYALSTAV